MIHKCLICHKETTKVLECTVCGEDVCSSCSEQCSVCKQWACHKHMLCIYKGVHVCTNCYADQLTNQD
ncbi:hypothetical protein [Desulforamulus ferrireducens]|uniref:hypothetical protein n=1 Tax=Desulforamulus ferrireducens TaxID=1833852 RepID=UPI0011EA5A67|nr:hypothetical protein [Desulforamulus ferrireducens]